MTASNIKPICALCVTCVTMLLLFVGSAFCFDDSSFESMLPDGLVIEDIYKPGSGSPVGKVRLVQGKVVIVHANRLRGYWAQKGLPLYKGDTITTRKKGRIRFKLNDGSTLTMASGTKLVINRSVYHPSKKRRSSFLRMSLGRARFWVSKLIGFKRSEFRVKTRTSVMGVRGSDFIIRATPNLTEVTTLKDTRLEVMSLAAPEVKPTLLSDFERTIVGEGALPSEVERVSPEEIELISKEFTVDLKVDRLEEKLTKAKGPEKKAGARQFGAGRTREERERGKDEDERGEKDVDEGREDKGGVDEGDKHAGEEGAGPEPSEEKRVSEEGMGEEGKDIVEKGMAEEIGVRKAIDENSGPEQGVVEKNIVEKDWAGGLEQPPIHVSDDELVMPEEPEESEKFEEPPAPEVFGGEEAFNQEEIKEQQETFSEEQHEEATAEERRDLPTFPGVPR